MHARARGPDGYLCTAVKAIYSVCMRATATERPPPQALGVLYPYGDHKGYRLRVSKDGAARFGRWLAHWIAHSGRYETPTALGRAAGISAATMSRWIRGEERPRVDYLEKLAPVVEVSVTDLIAIAYPERALNTVTSRPADIDENLARLASMLSPDSPLDDADRDYIRDILNRAIFIPLEPKMRRRRRNTA